jgi:hypothetical protein
MSFATAGSAANGGVWRLVDQLAGVFAALDLPLRLRCLRARLTRLRSANAAALG